MRTIKAMLAGLVLASMCVTAFAQVTFRVDELIVPPSQINTTKCVQVGVYATYNGGAAASWAQVVSTLDYTAPAGFLAGDPFVNVSDFAATPKGGLTNPGSAQDNGSGGVTSCAAGDIINRATLGGTAIDLAGGTGPGNLINQSVNTVTGRIDVSSSHFTQNMFTTQPGVEVLFAIIEFPLAAGQGNGQIDITFVPDAVVTDGNILTDIDLNTETATLDDGFIQVFQTQDCNATNHAVFTDAVSGASSDTTNTSSLNIDYLDAAFGGPGAEVGIAISYDIPTVSHIQVAGGGFDSGMVAADGSGTQNFTVNPPTGGGTTAYTVTYYTLDLGGDPAAGTPCTMTVGFNPASCTSSWVNNGIGGANSTFTVTLTNAGSVGGTFANVDVPAGATGIVDFAVTDNTGQTGTSGGTVTLVLVDQSIPDATWAGTWGVNDVTDAGSGAESLGNGIGTSADAGAEASCTDVIGFTCPTNSSTANQAVIESPLTVNLVGTDVLNWEVTYNGVTTTGIDADDATFTTPNNAVPGVNTIDVTATGFGPDGLACPDTQTITLDWVAPACVSTTQNPDSTVTAVDVGTVITLTLVTEGAVSATIDGVAMTVVAGTEGVSNQVTWTATHTATSDQTITAVITNEDGETDNCSWVIDINCIDPTIVSIAPVGERGILISGTPECVYTLRITDHNMDSSTDYDIAVGDDGFGYLDIVVPADSWFELGQLGLAGGVSSSGKSVPTLGEWGMIAFVMLLMVAGVAFMRRQRTV